MGPSHAPSSTSVAHLKSKVSDFSKGKKSSGNMGNRRGVYCRDRECLLSPKYIQELMSYLPNSDLCSSKGDESPESRERHLCGQARMAASAQTWTCAQETMKMVQAEEVSGDVQEPFLKLLGNVSKTLQNDAAEQWR